MLEKPSCVLLSNVQHLDLATSFSAAAGRRSLGQYIETGLGSLKEGPLNRILR